MSRARLSKREWDALYEQQGGKCCVAGCENEPTVGEHSDPLALSGMRKPDQLMCDPCHRIKTFGTHGVRGDISAIAKAKRISEGRTQYDRRKAFGPAMQSRNSFRKRGE